MKLAIKDMPVHLDAGDVILDGILALPAGASGIVLFAHGSGSSRHSPRNRFVARELEAAGIGYLLFDLLTLEEEEIDAHTGRLRFDIPFLARRVVEATDWTVDQEELAPLKIGYFGASTGAAAALVAAAHRPRDVAAVVSRGGRPDLARESLPLVQAPTLLIVGGLDGPVIGMNREAQARMRAPAHLEIVPGATHLFPEPGALETVARLACDWFTRYL